MLTEQEKEKLKKYPKWIKDYIKELEEKLSETKKTIRILNKEERESDIWVQTGDNNGFYLNNNARIKFKDGISIIEVYFEDEHRIVVQGHTCIKVLPRAWNSIRVKSEEY